MIYHILWYTTTHGLPRIFRAPWSTTPRGLPRPMLDHTLWSTSIICIRFQRGNNLTCIDPLHSDLCHSGFRSTTIFPVVVLIAIFSQTHKRHESIDGIYIVRQTWCQLGRISLYQTQESFVVVAQTPVFGLRLQATEHKLM